MRKVAGLGLLLVAAVLGILNTVGIDYFQAEIAAVSSHPSRGIVFLNLGGIYLATLLLLPVASMLKLIGLRMRLSRLLVQAAALGVVVALVLPAISGANAGALPTSADSFSRIVILVCMGLVSLGAPMTIYADLISPHLGPNEKKRRGPTDLPL
jgi:hypothetical protein